MEAEKLPGVLWAYRRIVRTPTGEMLFVLTYGEEAVILMEVRMLSYRVHHFDLDANNERLKE